GPGSVAEDGEPGRNGIYTGELLKALRKPGLRIGVREEIRNERGVLAVTSRLDGVEIFVNGQRVVRCARGAGGPERPRGGDDRARAAARRQLVRQQLEDAADELFVILDVVREEAELFHLGEVERAERLA